MINMLNNSQSILIGEISKRGGEANWYQIGRSVLHLLDNPGDFVSGIKFLIDEGYVEERMDGEGSIPKLHLTSKGRD
jgi:hypothetical protein